MNKIKVGIIGSGFIAEHHCYSYSLLPNVEIVGLSSLLKDQATELMKKFGIPGDPLKDYKDLLSDDGLHPNEKGHQMIFEIVRDYLL